MRKPELAGKLKAAVIGMGMIMFAICSKEAVLVAKAAQEPAVTSLEVAASTDGAGVIARCRYQNYTDQSGCEIRLYLYKIENNIEIVESQKILAYTEQGIDSTQPRQVDEGVYRASITIDNGVEIRQINSANCYRVSQIEGNYVVSEEVDKGEVIQPELEDRQEKDALSCSHVCEYIVIEEATPVKDAVQAYQCSKCGAVFEYLDVPNSAYTAFSKEVVNLIQNAQQEEIVVTTDRWMSFRREVFEAMKMNPEISVKVHYRYLGEDCSFVIPAGMDAALLMDENGYGGFRYIEERMRQAELTDID